MKIKSLITLVSLSVFASFNANAEMNSTYFGGAYHMGTYDETDFPNLNPNGIQIKAGKYVSNNVAIEAHLLFGAGSDSVNYFGTNVELKLKQALSVFVKGDLPLSPSANVYGLLGFTSGKLEASALGTSISENDSGLSYGIGAEVKMGENIFLTGEYLFYISESDYDYTGFNIGIKKLF